MGTWTLESIHTNHSPLTGSLFGHNFIAEFQLKYETSTFGSFTETPRLDWHEVIQMKEYHKMETWTLDTNMYTLKPNSKTLEIWPKRYIEAYNFAANGTPSGSVKGSSKLLDKRRQPVPVAELGRGLAGDQAKADAVRGYLKKKGGYLMVTIHDIPSINVPTGNEHKERLLVFNVGVEGQGMHALGQQYLDVDAAKAQGLWKREFYLSHQITVFNTTGFKQVPVPASVGTPAPPLWTAGECW